MLRSTFGQLEASPRCPICDDKIRLAGDVKSSGAIPLRGIMQHTGIKYFSFAKQDRHNAWLDLLRSLAIILVLLRHGSRIEDKAPSSDFFYNIFSNGWVGVDLFFVLSGYLIASGLIRRFELRKTLWPTGYFKDRILRIVPAYYAVLLLCVLGFFPGFLISSAAPGESFFAHLLFLQDYTGADINVVFWSLGVEEKFYILAPLLIILMVRARTMTQCAILGLSLLLISPISRGLAFAALDQPISYEEFFYMVRSPFHMSLEGFVFGIIAALFMSKGWSISKANARSGLTAIGTALLLILGSHDFYAIISAFDAWLQPTIVALLFGVMLFCAASLNGERVKFEPFFRTNARLSYALYLVHFPLIPLAIHLSQQQHALVFWVIYLLLTYAAAIALHFCVEKPFLILKNRAPKRDNASALPQGREVVTP